jgi:hypothetical protein
MSGRLEKPERLRDSYPAPSRRTWSAALALLPLLGAAAAAALPETSTHESESKLKTITVEAQRDRATLERRVKKFVSGITKVPFEDSLARWQKEIPMCPHVGGLTRDHGEYILSQLSQIAAAAGAPLAPEKCRPNFYVIVTSVPDELMAAWSKRDPWLFGNAGGTKVRQFLTASTPIRVWYNTEFYNGDGTPCEWIEGIPVCGAGGHIRWGAVRDLSSVIVLVDASRAKGISFGQLAAYIAMVGLAEIRIDPKIGDAPTILRLFADSANAPALGMSKWDAAYLKALYHTEHDDRMQLLALKAYMLKDVAP